MTGSAQGTPDPPDHGLVDRERDIAILADLVDRSQDGDGRFVVLEGPAGIGKSALLDVLREHVTGGDVTVLGARAGELEQELPYGVVRQLFEARVVTPEGREALGRGAAASAAPVFLAPGEVAVEEAGVFATLHGLYWLTADLAADGPLVVLVDDLHWCDAASLRYLSYLARRLDGLPVLLAATLRRGEQGTDARVLADLVHGPAADVVSLAPLTLAATGELVRRRLGDDAAPAFVTACHDVSAGNPLLLRQLLGALEADRVAPVAAAVDTVLEVGPRAVSRTVLRRLAGLPEEAIALARAVAVLGDGTALPHAARLAGIDDAAAARATGPLARADILLPRLPLEFVHPLVREAVHLEQPAGERAAAHAAAATVLRDAGAPAVAVAGQLLHAPPAGDPATAAQLHDAALDALARGAPESAASYLHRAIAEPPDPDDRGRLLYDLGRAAALTDGHEGVRHLTAALEDLREPVLRKDATWTLARLLCLLADPLAAQALCRRVREEVGRDDIDARASLVAFERAAMLFGGDPVSGTDGIEVRAGALGDSPGEKRLLAFTSLERCIAGAAADEVVPLALEALEGDVLLPADDTFLVISPVLVLVEADRPEGLAVLDAAQADAHRRGSLGAIVGVGLWRGYTLLRLGDLPGAATALEQADVAQHEWGAGDNLMGESYVAGLLADVRCEQGDLAAARAVLARPAGAPAGTEAWRLREEARVRLMLADGDAAAAVERAQELGQVLAAAGHPAWTRWRSLAARGLRDLGRTDDAAALLETDLDAARRWGAPGHVGRALRDLGDLREDETVLLDAIAHLERSTARLEHTRALLALGELRRRAGRPAEARDPLRRALELATGCGAEPVVAAARAGLHATGARPRATALSGAGALTAGERRVADRAAAGRTNREIAQELFVTTKTVEVHLSATYRKLGLSSRRQLAGALAGSAPAGDRSLAGAPSATVPPRDLPDERAT